MSASAFEVLGAIVACAGCGAALLARDPRARYAAMGIGLAAAAALIAGDVWDQARFEDLRSEPAALVLALLLGGIALGATAATFVRVPAAFAIAAFAVLPLRVPVQVGGETNYLLVPLYGVIAGGWLRAVWLLRSGRAEELQQQGSPSAKETPAVRWLCVALAVSLVVYAIGVAWSDDPTNGLRNVAFFLAPFAALMALLRDLRWHRFLVFQVLAATVLVALAFAALAIWQYGSRELLLNKDLKDANQLHLYFRVNSLFRDPNVLGRYLALAIVATGAWIAWRRPPRQALAGAVVGAVLLAGLAFTFSQTSFAALVAGLATLIWFRLGTRGLVAAVAMVAVAAGLFMAAGGTPESTLENKRDKERQDLAEVSSGRTDLVSGGIDLFERRPLQGWGSGSFAASFNKEIEKATRPISHTDPVTVAAEQGLLGVIPYVAAVLLAIACIARPWPAESAARAGVAACFAALFVHSLGYAGFMIDPAMWALLGLGLALREPPVRGPPEASPG